MQHFIIPRFFVFRRVFFLPPFHRACSFTPLIVSASFIAELHLYYSSSFMHIGAREWERERHHKNLNSSNILFELGGIKDENLIFIKRRNKFLSDHAATFQQNHISRDRLCDDDDDEFVISENQAFDMRGKRSRLRSRLALEFISILKEFGDSFN